MNKKTLGVTGRKKKTIPEEGIWLGCNFFFMQCHYSFYTWNYLKEHVTYADCVCSFLFFKNIVSLMYNFFYFFFQILW